MKANTCCFTGHRNIRKADEESIKGKILEQVLIQLQQGISTFMVGGAVGFDMLAAEVLLDLREKKAKELRLVSVLPYLAWREKWMEEDKDREDRILEKSDEILVSANEYSRHSYLDRDRRMVDSSAVCIAYCARKIYRPLCAEKRFAGDQPGGLEYRAAGQYRKTARFQ